MSYSLQEPVCHYEDKEHLQEVRSRMTCLICGGDSPDAHHLESRGSLGSDYSVVPLCRRHHAEFHSMGLRSFNDKYAVELWKEAWKIICEKTGLHGSVGTMEDV